MKRGRRFVLGTALLLLSAGGLALLVSRTSEPSAGPPGISDGPVLAASEDALGVPPERGASAPTASYVGRERCAECHLDQVKRHERSHHFWAMAEPTEERVVADFSQQPHVEPNEPPATVRKEGEQFFVKTEGASGKPREYKVRWTFGFEPLQQYLVEEPGGRLATLRLSWDSRPKDKGGQRWFHQYPGEVIPPGDPLHFLGPNQNYNGMCAECHSTGLLRGYDISTDTFKTSSEEINVSCEACHGPASGHVTWAESSPRANSPSRGFESRLVGATSGSWEAHAGSATRRLRAADGGSPSVNELQTCAPCHSRRALLSEDPASKMAFLDRALPALALPPLYFGDGQIRDEVYVYGSFTQSKMHQSGVTCSNCHEPHSGELRAADNNLCTQCHETSVYDAATHHRHQGGVSKGSFFGDGTRCVDCHMPRVTYMGVDVRHDHSFRVPRPDLSVRFDTPNACTTCHQDRDASWAARERVRLYGPPKTEAGRDVFSLLLAAEVGDPSARSALLAFATDETAPEMLRAMALTQGAALSQGTALSEGGETSDFRTLEAVVQRLSSDPSDLVRLSALSAAGRLPVPLRVPHLAGRLDDRVRAVRVEAMRQLLTEVPAGARANLTAKLSQAAREFKEAQKPFLDRASVRTEIAALELGLGDADSAETWLRRALEVDPTQLPAAINLSDLYRSRGDEKNAEATLRAILLRLPDAAPAHYALGLSLIRQKQLDDALDFLAKARALDPESVEYALTYAVALQSIGRLDAALTELSAGLRGRPYAAELHRARVSYLYGAGRKDEAVSALQDWLSADPESPEARSLAERLR